VDLPGIAVQAGEDLVAGGVVAGPSDLLADLEAIEGRLRD
jgi:hypothetical protein